MIDIHKWPINITLFATIGILAIIFQNPYSEQSLVHNVMTVVKLF